jgi:hypothetical protein
MFTLLGSRFSVRVQVRIPVTRYLINCGDTDDVDDSEPRTPNPEL